jgi:hypothetical protein
MPVVVNGTMSGPADNDYYRVTVPAGAQVLVRMTPNGTSDYDLKLHDATGRVLGDSERGTGVTDEIQWTNPNNVPMDVYVHVYFYASTSGNTYVLQVSSSGTQPPAPPPPPPAPPPPPPGTISEVESNNSIASAQPVTSPVTILGTMSSATDIDYYRVSVPAGGSILVQMTPNTSSDYDVKLRDATGRLLGDSERGTGVTDTIGWTNPSNVAVDVYVQVYFYAGGSSNTYTLVIN